MLTMDTASWGAELIGPAMDLTPWTEIFPVPQTCLDICMWPEGELSGMVFQLPELVEDELTTDPWTLGATLDTDPWTKISLVGDDVPYTQLLPVPQKALDPRMWPLGMLSGMPFQEQELADDILTTDPWTEL